MHVRQAAVNCRHAQQQYEQAFRDYFDHRIDRLPADRFWELQPVFRAEIVYFGVAHGNTPERAASEFVRKAFAQQYHARSRQPAPEYSFDEAIQFAATWSGLHGQLYQPLFDVVEDRSDDSYSDLLDSLPLAGRDVISQALQGEFANHRQFEQAVRSVCQDAAGLADLILHGENYVRAALYDAAKDFFASRARQNPEEPSWA